MSEAFQPTLSYAGSAVKPAVGTGTRMLLISFLPVLVVPVTAVAVTSEVIVVPLLVMKAFVPSMTHSPSSRRAVVRVPPASLPAPGSVSPKAPIALPATRSGRKRACCSGVPKR